MDGDFSNKKSFFAKKHNRVRAVYALIFSIFVVLALVFRSLGYKLFKNLYSFDSCQEFEGDELNSCVGIHMVFRISFVLFIFFFIQMLILIGYRGNDSADFRSTVQNGWWLPKIIFIVGLFIGSIFIPNSTFLVWGRISQILSGVFLLLQIIYLIGWIHDLSDKLTERDMFKTLLLFTVILYGIGTTMIILSFVYFTGSKCVLNIVFCVITIVLMVIYSAMSLKVETGSIFESGMAFAYCCYLLMAALASQQSTDCNPFSLQNASTLQIIPGILIAVIVINYSTFNLSGHSNAFRLKDNDDEDLGLQGQAPYSYSFFHFVYAMASLYLAMLITGWNLELTSTSKSVDTGAISMYVKLIIQWVVALLYGWSVIAPAIFSDRDFN
ncbi:serine incorporator [Anaeramoeba flamelloides]|uniref:Serine incorporator n=1 Tax=Anaeramoeba flamelloides TaxID=1746091 RepID=A0ABQ8YE56_9EUKA|nr:serine incorporator [Anaeramoeba flamelloides]